MKEAIWAFANSVSPVCSVESILYYPHPFTPGGIILVFANEVDEWSQQLAIVYEMAPPLSIHCLRQREIFQLSQPGLFAPPLRVNERPHLPYWLQHRGEVLYGADMRSEIRPFSPATTLLSGHIEGCMDYLRRYGVMTSLISKEFERIWPMLNQEMYYLMATALLIYQVWDVSLPTLPALFWQHFPNKKIQTIWTQFQLLKPESQPADYHHAVMAVWWFEQFLRTLRGYTDGTTNLH